MTHRPEFLKWHERAWRKVIDLVLSGQGLKDIQRAVRPKAFKGVCYPPSEYAWDGQFLHYRKDSPFVRLVELTRASRFDRARAEQTARLCLSILDGVVQPDIVPPPVDAPEASGPVRARPFRADIDG